MRRKGESDALSTFQPDPLPDTLRDVPDLVPARMLNAFAYCPRSAYLEWVQNEFADNADTVDGRFQHRRVDQAVPDDVPGAEGTEAGNAETIHARSVMLSGPESGFIARMDLLELEGRVATPVDYKRGKVPALPERSWEPERVQLCVAGLILRENGFECDRGVIYFVESKTRVEVEFGDELVSRTKALAAELRDTVLAGKIPPPLADSPKCPRCSLVGICLPDETNALSDEAGRGSAGETRRLVPARDDCLGLYVHEQGALIGKQGEVLQVRGSGQVLAELRLLDTSHVSVFGNVQISTQALRELAQRGIPIAYFSHGGWFYGITQGMAHKNVELRIKQYQGALHPETSLRVARRFVAGKIRNCRTLLRRNHAAPPPEAISDLARLATQALAAKSPATLLGIEGAAARCYFGHFAGMLKEASRFDFTHRNRRPPKDAVNAVLSFVYALLVKDLTITALRVGFDPYLGFFHRPRYGRPALALDLAEEFRPLIGDSVVLTVLNTKELGETDFVSRAGAVVLSPAGRKKVIAAYERRMDALIVHPVFRYSVSYRRVLEVQARLLSRVLLGELPAYPMFTTR